MIGLPHASPRAVAAPVVKGIYILYIRCVKRGNHLRAAEVRTRGAVRGRTSTRAAKRTPSAWTAVYRLVKRIPKGRVLSYGELARVINLPGGARAAGYAMAACPQGQGIPWHRVVGAGGRILLGEPRGALQRRLLESEGVEFRGQRLELDGRAWTPPKARKPSRAKASRRTPA